MTDQPTMNDETIDKFRRIRDLTLNPHNNFDKSLHEIFCIVQEVLHDHAPEFEVMREYIAKYGSEPK